MKQSGKKKWFSQEASRLKPTKSALASARWPSYDLRGVVLRDDMWMFLQTWGTNRETMNVACFCLFSFLGSLIFGCECWLCVSKDTFALALLAKQPGSMPGNKHQQTPCHRAETTAAAKGQ